MKSSFWAPIPPTRTSGPAAWAATRTRASVSRPAALDPSARPNDSTRDAWPECQLGAGGATAPCTPFTRASCAATCAGDPPRTRTSCGSSAPAPMPERSSATSPSLASPFLATVLALGTPGCRVVAASTSAARMSAAPPAASQRWRTIPCAQRVQARLALSSVRRCGQSRRRPTELSTTGSRVSATATLTSGMSIPPYPTLRRKGSGRATSARRPIATVVPLKTTARPAVAIARATASSPWRPCARSSRHRTTTSSA